MSQRYALIIGAALIAAVGMTLFNGADPRISGPEAEVAPADQKNPEN